MSNKNELAAEIEAIFLKHNYTWVDEEGIRFIPTSEHILKALDNLRDTVVGSLDQTEGPDEYVTVEAGRLFVIGQGNRMDVYVHSGELPLTEE